MSEIAERRRNWAPWLALLFILIAIGLNAATFMTARGVLAILWLGLVTTVVALVYSIIGIKRAFGQSAVFGGKISSSTIGVLALLFCGLMAFAWFGARTLPASGGAPHVGQKAPEFTLADTQGNNVSLAQLLGRDGSIKLAAGAGSSTLGTAPPKAVLLIFYRGYW
jgi:hypothetical protein